MAYDPEASYEIAEFSNSEAAYCPLTYELSTVPADVSFLTIDGNNRKVTWFTESNSDQGNYKVVVRAKYEETVLTDVDYTL